MKVGEMAAGPGWASKAVTLCLEIRLISVFFYWGTHPTHIDELGEKL